MTDTEELTERYLALWTQYLTALMANPQAMETLKRWAEFAGRFSYPASGATQPGNAPFPAWPPFFGPFAPPLQAGAGADGLAALTRRVDELERRLAALEDDAKPRARRARRRTRPGAG